MKRFLIFLFCAFFLFGLFFRAGEVALAVHRAALLCLDALLPSLFPFLSVSLFLSMSGAGRIFSLLLFPLTKWGLRLPPALGETVLFSLIGGYPAGARLLSSLVKRGQLTDADASVLLCFCVSPGPAFVVIAVGKVMFGSLQTGALLLFSQLTASLLLGGVLCRARPVRLLRQEASPLSVSSALTAAVSDASGAMLSICSWVVLCAAAGAMLPQGSFSSAILPLLEVTSGCQSASQASSNGVVTAAFLLAFGGISVCCQILSIAAESGIPAKGFFPARMLCGLLSSLIARLLFFLFPQAKPASVLLSAPIAVSTPNRFLEGICLCGMIFLTLSNVSCRKNIDFPTPL